MAVERGSTPADESSRVFGGAPLETSGGCDGELVGERGLFGEGSAEAGAAGYGDARVDALEIELTFVLGEGDIAVFPTFRMAPVKGTLL